MKKVQRIIFRGTALNHEAARKLLDRDGDTALVVRGKPRLLLMRCPCGCGDDLIINLDRDAGKAWNFYSTGNGKTLYPSYWRTDKCGSHFIIWNDNIYWCYGWGTERTNEWYVSSMVESKVFDSLPEDKFRNYERIAEDLNLIPWEVLQACYQLVKRDQAISEKPGAFSFRKKKRKCKSSKSWTA